MRRNILLIGLALLMVALVAGLLMTTSRDMPYLSVTSVGEDVVGPDDREPITISRGQFSQNDVTLMARAVYGEARGEPYVGQVAVAAVVLNRIKHPDFPDSVSGVIFQPLAFTAVADGQIWLEPNDVAYRAVNDALNGSDPTGGAIYYFNPAVATSKWIWSRPQIGTIGKHIFAR